MEMDNTNAQQPSDQSPTIQPESGIFNQMGYVPIIIGGIILIIIVGVVAYMLGTRSNKPQSVQQNQQVIQPSPTSTSLPINTTTSTVPKLVAFMRKGDIFIKNFSTGKEVKVSKTSPVDTPQLSYDGKYISYFYLIHGGDGFPTSNIYVADTQGGYEADVGVGNLASRLTWAKDGNYVGFVSHFTDGKPTTAILYDPTLRKSILEQEVNTMRKDTYGNSVLTTDKSYNISLPCTTVEQKYISFCKQYESVLNKDLTYEDTTYNREEYSKSQYAKPNYNLTRSRKLPNGLVILEYYTGEPQNPESKWGIGGGSFIPGYDEGVTQTYSLLIGEPIGKVIQEIPLSIDTDWVF